MSEKKKHSEPKAKQQNVTVNDLKPAKDTRGGHTRGGRKTPQTYVPPKKQGW
jgi:hypothetical protein